MVPFSGADYHIALTTHTPTHVLIIYLYYNPHLLTHTHRNSLNTTSNLFENIIIQRNQYNYTKLQPTPLTRTHDNIKYIYYIYFKVEQKIALCVWCVFNHYTHTYFVGDFENLA